jgi:hypothetical protein
MINEIQETGQKDVSTQYATSRTIKYLFAKFHARYGSKWQSQFPEDLWPLVQSEWLAELKEMTADDIKRGLDTWHEFWPPNVFEFKDACKLINTPTLAAHKERVPIAPINTSPEDAKKNVKRIREAIHGAGILETGEYFGKSVIQDPEYLKAQEALTRAMREAVDNINFNNKRINR